DVTNFTEKLQRKRDRYDSPFDQIMDLAGLRIITYYLEDVDTVENLLAREFEIDWNNSLDKGKQLNPDQFGYLSRHFVVKLKSPRIDLQEWAPFRGLVAEIQVRTALQHAWAAVNHKLEYKAEDEVPLELKRGLHRLSALFEIADGQFSDFRNSTRGVESAYGQSVSRGNFDLDLNLKSLNLYLGVKSTRDRLSTALIKAGGRIENGHPMDLIRWHRQLIQILSYLKVDRLGQLNELVDAIVGDPALIQAVVETPDTRDAVNIPELAVEDLLIQALIVREPRLDDLVDAWDEGWTDWVSRARQRWTNPRS
ncbi:MAG: pyrophosphokinae, partial [Pseudonocardiales bacterium]|nr:pyrophosphokinae [Pseudonocardiales bacterium]